MVPYTDSIQSCIIEGSVMHMLKAVPWAVGQG
jgi:hypothetical protein